MDTLTLFGIASVIAILATVIHACFMIRAARDARRELLIVTASAEDPSSRRSAPLAISITSAIVLEIILIAALASGFGSELVVQYPFDVVTEGKTYVLQLGHSNVIVSPFSYIQVLPPDDGGARFSILRGSLSLESDPAQRTTVFGTTPVDGWHVEGDSARYTVYVDPDARAVLVKSFSGRVTIVEEGLGACRLALSAYEMGQSNRRVLDSSDTICPTWLRSPLAFKGHLQGISEDPNKGIPSNGEKAPDPVAPSGGRNGIPGKVGASSETSADVGDGKTVRSGVGTTTPNIKGEKAKKPAPLPKGTTPPPDTPDLTAK